MWLQLLWSPVAYYLKEKNSTFRFYFIQFMKQTAWQPYLLENYTVCLHSSMVT